MTKGRADIWLRAWGAVLRERLITGDPSAVPRRYEMEEELERERCLRRGRVGRTPAVLDAFMDVERVLGKQRPSLRAVLLLIYRDSCNEVTVSRTYAFMDGSGSVEVLDGDPDPVGAGAYVAEKCEMAIDESWRSRVRDAIGSDAFDALSNGTRGFMIERDSGRALKVIRGVIRDFGRELTRALTPVEERRQA